MTDQPARVKFGARLALWACAILRPDWSEGTALDTADPRTRRAHLLLLAAITLLGMTLRVWRIGEESATGDEVFTLALLNAPGLQAFWEQSFAFDPTARLAPVFGTLAYGWACLFGPGLLAARMLPLLLGCVSIPLLYIFARRLAGPPAGLIAALGLALSSAHRFYSQDVRFYALLCFLALLSMLLFVRALESGGRWNWTAYFLVNAALLWTHAFAPLLWLAQGAFFCVFFSKPLARLRAWAAGLALLLALFLAWLCLLHYAPETESAAYVDRPAGWREAATALLVFLGVRSSDENPAAYMPGGVSMDIVVGALFLALASYWLAVTIRNRRARPEDFRQACLLLLWLGVPMAVLLFLSAGWRMVFYHRYILYSCFAAHLIVALAMVRLPRLSLRVTVGVLYFGLCGYQAVAMPRPERADYQQAARAIAGESAPCTVHALKPFNARGAAYALGLPSGDLIENWGLPELCAETVADLKDGKPAVWVLFHRWERTQDFERSMQAAGCAAAKTIYPGMPPLIAYRVTHPAGKE